MKRLILTTMLLNLFAFAPLAQTTEFTFQGRLLDGGLPPTGSYDIEFTLWDSLVGGTQLGPTETKAGVSVSGGIFTVRLDFGAQFTGPARFIEISVKPSGPGAFTPLAPRQPITSTPYAVKSLNADTAATASDASNLGGVPAADFVVTTDPRMTDDRNPIAGSANYIQNQNAGPQSSSNFNISGTGTANILSAATQYNIGANRILSNPGPGNLFAGVLSGTSNTTGVNNSFFGSAAGASNTTGLNNAFFGANAGLLNSNGNGSSFFGSFAGFSNTSGSNNSFFGLGAGQNNSTASNNAFFGTNAGQANTTGSENSFFGRSAGENNTTGLGNAFFGKDAGYFNTTGSANSFFGTEAGRSNTTGSFNLFFGRFAGRSNTTGGQNAFFGSDSGLNNTDGSQNAFFGTEAGRNNTSGGGNAFFGTSAGGDNTTGINNAFFGTFSGANNTTGFSNAFFGASAGFSNVSGINNAFFGIGAGDSNTTGSNNTIIGSVADVSASNLSFATAIGAGSIVSSSNTIALGRTSGADAVVLYGLGATAGNTALCRNATNQISTCLGASVPGGSSNYIQNTASPQASSNFNISGTGTANIFSAGTQYNIGTDRILANPGTNNLFAGVGAGQSNTTGALNSFFGSDAGFNNTTATSNSFFGQAAGLENLDGSFNSFFGQGSGFSNTAGFENAFFGASAGSLNTTGSNNTIVGTGANVSAGNLTNATAIGSGAVVNASNKIRLGNASVTVIEGQVAYTFTSDKNVKENFLPVNGRDVLRKIRGFNMTSWNYIGQDATRFRHYGPMAQDFYNAFGRDAIGTFGSPTTINSGDMAGITLAAIKELSIENETLKTEIGSQQKQIETLQRQVDALKKLICKSDPQTDICKEEK